MSVLKKTNILLLATLVAFFCFACKKSSTTSQVKETPEALRLKLPQDSGYICAGEALSFLLSNELIDTTSQSELKEYFRYTYSLNLLDGNTSALYYQYWDYKPTDTIGKYYFVPRTERYLAALLLSNSIMLLELTGQGEPTKYNTDLGHGSHPCCWVSLDDILKRYGNYFGIITCGTGSAHCSASLTLFNDTLEPLVDYIPLSVFNGSFGKEFPGQLLSSTIELKSDSLLVMHYELEEYTENEDEVRKAISFKKFTVTYILTNNRFETNEADKLDDVVY